MTTNTAYRGYLITPLSAGGYAITKDGFLISRPKTAEAARKDIDALLNLTKRGGASHGR